METVTSGAFVIIEHMVIPESGANQFIFERNELILFEGGREEMRIKILGDT
jgi:hypothetical protein